eukprot:g4313.t1
MWVGDSSHVAQLGSKDATVVADLAAAKDGSLAGIVVVGGEDNGASVHGPAMEKLKPGGLLLVLSATEEAASAAEMDLVLAGFVDASTEAIGVSGCEMHKTQVARPKWSLLADDTDDDGEGAELEDEDSLLAAASTLDMPAKEAGGDCSTRRRACKDCSCGRAELEQSGEMKGELPPPPSGGCGNCAKGDAFRCAGCPYLGQPAFKPGNKVKLALSDDL